MDLLKLCCETDMSEEQLNVAIETLDRAIEARATLEALGLDDVSMDELKDYKRIFENELNDRETARTLEDWRRAQDLIGEAIR